MDPSISYPQLLALDLKHTHTHIASIEREREQLLCTSYRWLMPLWTMTSLLIFWCDARLCVHGGYEPPLTLLSLGCHRNIADCCLLTSAAVFEETLLWALVVLVISFMSWDVDTVLTVNCSVPLNCEGTLWSFWPPVVSPSNAHANGFILFQWSTSGGAGSASIIAVFLCLIVFYLFSAVSFALSSTGHCNKPFLKASWKMNKPLQA